MASPSLRDDSASTEELYSTFIKKMKTENLKLNISEVGFSRRKGGKNSFGKRGSSAGISNDSNDAVDDRFFEKHEYHAIAPEQTASQAAEMWTCWKWPWWKWQWQWKRQRQRQMTHYQVTQPLYCGVGHEV
jgi:hypothetical protein